MSDLALTVRSRLDDFVARELRPGRYARYVDDFLLFGEDKQEQNVVRARKRLSKAAAAYGRLGAAEVDRVLIARNNGVERRILPRDVPIIHGLIDQKVK